MNVKSEDSISHLFGDTEENPFLSYSPERVLLRQVKITREDFYLPSKEEQERTRSKDFDGQKGKVNPHTEVKENEVLPRINKINSNSNFHIWIVDLSESRGANTDHGMIEMDRIDTLF